jgi:NADPH:quinone reductase-like Zn-dependent oxidoreductase
MRAIAIDEFGGPEKLKLVELPRPKPGKGEILIKVVAAGVNPVDYKIREGMLEALMPHAFPLIPGWDVAGVVEEQGEGAGRFRRGDRVWAYARKPTVQWGCYADYVTLPEENVALMPAKLLFEEAASIPLAALTAYQALFGAPVLEKGSKVLVHAAAGGVGHFAVQLAANAGAEVIGTAGTANQAFVLEMGAGGSIDYTKEDFADAAKRLCSDGFDFILDCVGGETQTRSFPLLKPRGLLVSIVGEPSAELTVEHGVRSAWIFVEPDAEQLTQLARFVDQGKLTTHVQKIYPLAEALGAQKDLAAGHVRGKLVLNL